MYYIKHVAGNINADGQFCLICGKQLMTGDEFKMNVNLPIGCTFGWTPGEFVYEDENVTTTIILLSDTFVNCEK